MAAPVPFSRPHVGQWLLLVFAPVLLLPEVMPLGVVCLALALVPVQFWLTVRRLPRGHLAPFSGPVLLLLLSVPVSLLIAGDARLATSKLAGLLLGVLAWAEVASWTRSARSTGGPREISAVRFASALLWIAAAAVAAAALVATDWPSKSTMLGLLAARMPRLLATIPHALAGNRGINANEVGGGLALVMPLCAVAVCGAWLAALWPRRLAHSPSSLPGQMQRLVLALFLTLGAAFIALPFLLAQSRGAFLGVAAGLFVSLWMGLPRYRAGLAVAVLGVTLLGALLGGPTLAPLLMDAVGAGASDSSLGVSGRLEVWQRALYVLQDFPLTGIGLNQFAPVVALLYPLFQIPSDVVIVHAHNVVLQVGMDLGLPGIVSYIGLVAVFFGAAYFSAARPELRWTAAGFAGGMAAFQVYGLTDAIALGAKPGLLFWLLIGAMAVLYRETLKRGTGGL